MIAYVKGILENKSSDYVIIDVSGIGYKVYMSETSIDNLGNIGDIVKVHTYYRVREDDISLFGFNTAEELRMFELLISVSGVGAKTAVTMLSCVTPSEFAIAVIQNDISKLTNIPGIGAKSAQRIVLELKDKLKKDENISKQNDEKVKEAIKDDNLVSDAINALQVLGYNRKVIEKAIEKIDTQNMSVEDIIKKGLVILGM